MPIAKGNAAPARMPPKASTTGIRNRKTHKAQADSQRQPDHAEPKILLWALFRVPQSINHFRSQFLPFFKRHTKRLLHLAARAISKPEKTQISTDRQPEKHRLRGQFLQPL